MSFDGYNNYITLPPQNFSGAITVEACVKNNGSAKSWARIIDFGNGSRSDNIILAFIGKTGKMTWNVYNGDRNKHVDTTEVFPLSKWVHVAATIDDNGNATIYWNGEIKGAGKIYVPKNIIRNNQYIAKSNWPDDYFEGQMADVRIWSIARTQAEIQENMNQRLTGKETGLEVYLPLNKLSTEGATTKVIDLANNNDGTVDGAILTTANPQFVKEYTEIINEPVTQINEPITQVMSFDGNSDYINCGSAINLANKSFTIEFWAKRGTINNLHQFSISQGSPSSNMGLHIGFRSNNMFTLAFYGKDLDTPKTYTDKQWHHWSCTYNSTTKERIVYCDGDKVASDIANANYQGTGDLLIAQRKNSHFFNGNLSEIRIWNTVRTQEEIQGNMNQRLTGKETGLEVYLPLNKLSTEGATTKVVDLANNNDGIVYGATLTTTSSQFVKEYKEVTTDPITPVMNFDGSGDYVEIQQYKGVTGTNPRTVEAWIKPNTTPAAIASWGDNQPSRRWTFRVNETTDKLRVEVNGGYIVGSTPLNDGKWHHVACTWQNDLSPNVTDVKLYVDGKLEVISSQASRSINTGTSRNVFIGNDFFNRFFSGNIAEVRIWNVVRTQAEIQENMNKRLTGSEAGLQLYLPLDQIESGKVVDLANNFQGTVYGNTSITNDTSFPVIREGTSGEYVINSLPLSQGIDNVSPDSLVTSVEYNTYHVDPITQKQSAMMRRMFAYPTENGAQLLQDKRIENLELLWIGNAQFAPTLLGYIEGAPPVPSENMNIDGDYQYNGATSVQLTTTEDVEYSWNRAQDTGLGANIDVFVGVESSNSAGIGLIKEVAASKLGVVRNLDLSYQWLNESNIVSNSALVMTDRLELRGAPEVTPKFPHYGNRFIPKNVGYALVVSALADVFITRLSRTQKMVGYEIRPVEDIPPDVNTITFLMNPAYVMNGSLDGLVGSSAANDEFYSHVPEMRAQYGSLYPASYFRLIEAYNLKQQIEKADKERLSYFENFNSNLVDETSLNRQAGDGTLTETVSLNEGAESIDASGQQLTEEETQAQLDQIQTEGGAKLEDLKQQGNERKQEINSRINDVEQRIHALESFARWQKTMENILVRSGKRNIVNS